MITASSQVRGKQLEIFHGNGFFGCGYALPVKALACLRSEDRLYV